MAKIDELQKLMSDALADDRRCGRRTRGRNGTRVLGTEPSPDTSARLRLAQEFDAFADDGSDVTPW